MKEKLLLTGGSGFLGRNIIPILNENYCVTTCGIVGSDDIYANLASEVPHLSQVYDIVLHACGKAHVTPKTEEEIKSFYDINYQGTVNLCRALERVGVPKALVFISTVAVYGLEKGNMIKEDAPRNGETPYAKSKIMAEDYLISWCKKHNVVLGILRPSLLAGPGAPGNLGAMVKGIKKGFYVNIDHGRIVKSILMAEDIANIVPFIVQKGGIYNVCDTNQPSFGQLSELIARNFGKKKPISIPYQLARFIGKIGDCFGSNFFFNSKTVCKMTESLTFSNEKARKELGWEPMDVLTNYKP